MAADRTQGPPYDLYDDLAAAVLRLEVDAAAIEDRLQTFGDLRHTFTVELGSWERMLEQILHMLADDAGSVGRGLALLGVPEYQLIDAWTRGPTVGMQASVRWLARQPRAVARDIRLRVAKIQRGDDYADLAESARSFRLRGNGHLDPARLRPRYTIELRRSWLRMVGDLLGQVVADAGSCEQAAIVLAVPQRRLTRWLRWFVSRGSPEAAKMDWPVALVDDIDGTRPYADLAAAILRGEVSADWENPRPGPLPLHELQEFYRVRLGPWDEMLSDLLSQICIDAGSVRKASVAISLPRSTLSAKLRRYRERGLLKSWSS